MAENENVEGHKQEAGSKENRAVHFRRRRPAPKKMPEQNQQAGTEKIKAKPNGPKKDNPAAAVKQAAPAVKVKKSPETQTAAPKQGKPEQPKTKQAPRPAKPRPEQPAAKPKAEQQPKAKQAPKSEQPKPQQPKQQQAKPQQAKPEQQPRTQQPKPQQPKQQNSSPKSEAAGPRPTAPQAEGARPARKPVRKAPEAGTGRAFQTGPKLRIADIDFKYLDNPDFSDIYALVSKANSYYETDKETCCAKFRIANEAIITRLIDKLELKDAMEKNSFEQINLLKEKIPADMVTENIFSEMHNVRKIGNSFVHNDDKYDAVRGCKTCLIATDKICRWLVEFEPKYNAYKRAREVTKSSFMDMLKGFFSFFTKKK